MLTKNYLKLILERIMYKCMDAKVKVSFGCSTMLYSCYLHKFWLYNFLFA